MYNVTRREFIAALAAGAFAWSRALAEDCTELSSDTHISFADIIDGVPHPRNAAGRARCFPHANDALKAALAYAREHDEMVVHTGDLIDYVNEKNLAAARMWTSASRGGIIVAGNHEYCQMVGDGKTEDESYKAETRFRVPAAYPPKPAPACRSAVCVRRDRAFCIERQGGGQSGEYSGRI